ncbi:MAG: hypothetical protein NTZ35_15110 [Ignavibacteriales bacterium]|nr:hypothetical protein [Ignavibacteriales bacterium]
MMDDRDRQQPLDESPSSTNRSESGNVSLRKIVAAFVLLDIIGVWIFMVRMMQLVSVRARGLRWTIFVGAVVFTVIGIVLERYLLPGIVARVGKKLALYLIAGLVALYVFYPAIEYLRGDDDIYVASIGFIDGRKLQDAQKVAATLKVLSGNAKASRVELSKRDYTRLRQRSYRVQLLQSPAQQYRAELINARPPGLPDRHVEQMIHSISSDSLMHHVHVLERFGTRVNHSPQADSAADYIANAMKRYGLEVESMPFESPAPMYTSADGAASRFVSRNICGTLR